MQIEERTVGDVLILDVKGRITLGEGDELLKDKVNSLLNQGQKKIVLNLAAVPYIDSAGLGILVAMHLSAKNKGTALYLCNLGQKFHEVLQITTLLTVFEVYDTEAAAVASLSKMHESETYLVAG